MKRQHILLPAIVISLLLLQLTFAALPRYEITDLGTLGGNWSFAWSINDSGQIVGRAQNSAGGWQAFLWSDNTDMVELGSLGGDSEAFAINDAGQVVGRSEVSGIGGWHAFLWSSTTGMIDLGTLSGRWSYAYAINNMGQVAGWSQTSNSNAGHAFLWQEGVMIDIHGEGERSEAHGINDLGQVVGYIKALDIHAFLWDREHGMIDLGVLGGRFSSAAAINNAGQVVGNTHTATSNVPHAFIWDNNSGMVELGTLGGQSSGASGINNIGQVAGGSELPHNIYHAVLWDPINGMIDLNTFLPKDSGWDHLIDATGINNRGHIVGYGLTSSGAKHAFLMTPVPVIIYVDADATGANDGSSWADAYNYLQDALNAAYSGDEIRVAQGAYKPDQGTGITPGDREATFQLKNGVTLKGGYAGAGTSDPNARDIQLYETILTGDLNGDDGPDFTNNDENSYHVLTGSHTDETAVLDGFTITGGNANGPWHNSYCGGGMYNYDSSPIVINCTFSGNSAFYSGGGMHNYFSSPTVTNCIFSGNSADRYGGGIGCRRSSPIVTNCAFSDNSASYGGGGMDNYLDSKPTLTNCIFSGNTGEGGGGGIGNTLDSSPTLINCTFTDNYGGWGGGMGTYMAYESPELTNCIFWGNTPDEIYDEKNATIITYSDVQGGWPGLGNIDADPCFVEPGYWDANGVWIDGDYHLLPDSPCINAGDPNYIAEPNETDLDGNPRVIRGRIDMGAYEAPIFAEARIAPRTINLASKGKWITCYISLPEDYDVTEIEPNSVLLEGEIKPEEFSVDQQKQVAVAKFSRSEVQEILNAGEVELTITGQLTDGTIFEGTDTIKVIDKAGKK